MFSVEPLATELEKHGRALINMGAIQVRLDPLQNLTQ